MMAQPIMGTCNARTIPALPLELYLHILDQLVGMRYGQQPVAYGPHHAVTQTLRSLTLVSRKTYHVASKYLYSHCIYLDDCTNYTRLRRTLGLDIGSHPQSLRYGESGRNEMLFATADPPRYITSAFISPLQTTQDGTETPMIRLPEVIDLFRAIGPTLKRLALDLQTIYTTASEIEHVRPYLSGNNIFLHMPVLEELIASYNVLEYFPFAPPNLKRLAITFQEIKEPQLQFCFSTSSLQTLVMLRPPELLSRDLDLIFSSYKGRNLDVIFVDVNSNHRTPSGTRSWEEDDTVKMWEMDVPTSFYGDEDDLELAEEHIWTHGVDGTLWSQSKRRMTSWAEIQRKLAGPIHLLMDDLTT
ncbi:hypothetical protein BDU57DRAFT_460875 [Ampelomyces quisqualis]|uniref:F-box domain-containing protein n=1 Tax=Ampelomyces quisqualis TaxID=50730 RepID=A0A6A5QA28_AMPQU|nr:hypothetical protein BDU57DRAFT_460875 [Ampelomyces quisqualis]